ncbi:hypothetical protein EI94DRAFT_1557192, partial [Lactarius quietus]
TVVPQQRWLPANSVDFQRHVVDAVLQLPIFFFNHNGSIGFSLWDILRGCDRDLRNSNDFAPLGGKFTTRIVINVSYESWMRQIPARDETYARNPITMARFMKHVGTSVDKLFRVRSSRITPDEVKVIGAIHVSAGTW